jgi:hypothetical protein
MGETGSGEGVAEGTDLVARIERSEIRGAACAGFPDFAALNPGYGLWRFSHARTPLQKPSPNRRNLATLSQIALRAAFP